LNLLSGFLLKKQLGWYRVEYILVPANVILCRDGDFLLSELENKKYLLQGKIEEALEVFKIIYKDLYK